MMVHRPPPLSLSLSLSPAVQTKPIFILYLERIAAAAVPRNRYSKIQIYRIRAELEGAPKFSGKSLLLKVLDRVSNYL